MAPRTQNDFFLNRTPQILQNVPETIEILLTPEISERQPFQVTQTINESQINEQSEISFDTNENVENFRNCHPTYLTENNIKLEIKNTENLTLNDNILGTQSEQIPNDNLKVLIQHTKATDTLPTETKSLNLSDQKANHSMEVNLLNQNDFQITDNFVHSDCTPEGDKFNTYNTSQSSYYSNIIKLDSTLEDLQLPKIISYENDEGFANLDNLVCENGCMDGNANMDYDVKIIADTKACIEHEGEISVTLEPSDRLNILEEYIEDGVNIRCKRSVDLETDYSMNDVTPMLCDRCKIMTIFIQKNEEVVDQHDGELEGRNKEANLMNNSAPTEIFLPPIKVNHHKTLSATILKIADIDEDLLKVHQNNRSLTIRGKTSSNDQRKQNSFKVKLKIKLTDDAHVQLTKDNCIVIT